MGTGKSTEEGIDPASGWERFIYYSKETSSYNLVVTQWISLRNASQSSLPRTKQLNKHKQPWYFLWLSENCRNVEISAEWHPMPLLSRDWGCHKKQAADANPGRENHPPTLQPTLEIFLILRSNYGLSTLQCNVSFVSCRQIMNMVWSGQLWWCHRLINWSEHDTHSTDTLHNNPMIIIWGLIFTKFTYPHDQPGPPSPVHSLTSPTSLTPHYSPRLLPSPTKISGIWIELSVTKMI